jgi:hypothetical protein
MVGRTSQYDEPRFEIRFWTSVLPNLDVRNVCLPGSPGYISLVEYGRYNSLPNRIPVRHSNRKIVFRRGCDGVTGMYR